MTIVQFELDHQPYKSPFESAYLLHMCAMCEYHADEQNDKNGRVNGRTKSIQKQISGPANERVLRISV